MRVTVSVANLWVAPDRPRPVDAAAVADHPDPAVWLRALDEHPADDEGGDGRLGLHRRLHTQLVAGEPALMISESDDGWVEVCAPWQPSGLDPRGYSGWVRRAHLAPDDGSSDPSVRPAAATDPQPGGAHPLLTLARLHLGLPYLWGGVTPDGLDCSGLVHWAMRQLGRVFPRDADDQEVAVAPVPWDDVRAGDLYFFRHPGATYAYHVGIVTAPGHMIHAPETGQGIVEEPLAPGRVETLSSAGRVSLRD
ncbi:MAG: C40 family peptidase [Lapillicoccus sp.]